ncbi:hypothetical protein NGM10_06770 [Halorussus salilacus]|uniref:hypothetical protein n=1 Tax=Halorussus salilacus TaxID=2953750 RepID=UPI0020A223B3|nr:hypothetical protein [Halorussus salilacus]USZ69430.1 hypothetical protein NGM10_06770 [Halorussus salilacus]
MSTDTELKRPDDGREPDGRPPGYVVGSAPDSIEREIGHDEFDPVGTLTLILAYFAILVVMWVFMYFVEFLGRGITVVG